MVAGQVVSITVNRILAYNAFYDNETKNRLAFSVPAEWRDTLKNLWNTAFKSGLTGLSWIVSNRMLAAFAGLYIPLSVIGDYGLSKQVAEITYTLSVVWFVTFYPKITQHKITNNISQLKRMYFKSLFVAFSVFLFCITGALLMGDTLLDVIGSKTRFIENWLMIALLISALLDGFTYISTSVLLAGNEVPHYKAQLITAVLTVLILFIFLHFTDYGLVAIVLVPLGCNLVYNHWRWATVVIKSFK
jgi:O-antigen/teichoic acid export membrane protein